MKALHRIQKKLPQILSAFMLSVFLLVALFTAVEGVPASAQTASTSAPIISTVSISTSQTKATIKWVTDQNANSTVDYGTSPAYAAASSTAALVTTHQINIQNLIPHTTYHFKVSSTNAAGKTSSLGDYTATTKNTNTSNTTDNGFGNDGTIIPIGGYVNVDGSSPATPTAAPTVPPKSPVSKDQYSGLVKCSGVASKPGEVECNFNYFIKTVANLINWGFYIAIPIVVVLFSWAGLLYISGVEKNIDKAKGIFLNAAIGFIIMLVAFTAVHTIVGWLVDPTIGAESLLSK